VYRYFTKPSPLPTYFTVPDPSLFIIPKFIPCPGGGKNYSYATACFCSFPYSSLISFAGTFYQYLRPFSFRVTLILTHLPSPFAAMRRLSDGDGDGRPTAKNLGRRRHYFTPTSVSCANRQTKYLAPICNNICKVIRKNGAVCKWKTA